MSEIVIQCIDPAIGLVQQSVLIGHSTEQMIEYRADSVDKDRRTTYNRHYDPFYTKESTPADHLGNTAAK